MVREHLLVVVLAPARVDDDLGAGRPDAGPRGLLLAPERAGHDPGGDDPTPVQCSAEDVELLTPEI
jgi:hypothetical protein